MDILFLLNMDVAGLLCKKLDAFSLVRMGMSSKNAWNAVNKEGIMEAAARRMFPGIYDLPKDKDSHFYLSIFDGYFSPSLFPPMHHLVISTTIYEHIKHNPNAEEPSLRTARIAAKAICRNLHLEVSNASHRKNIINSVTEWMDMIRNNRAGRLDLCDDVLAILATTKAFLQKSFTFRAISADGKIGYVSCY